jgi:excisionase family DNA binding protein
MNLQALETRIAITIERTLEKKISEIGKLRLKFYSPASIADMMEVDPQTIRRLCKKGEINAVRVGTELRIEQRELLRWLESFQ